MAKRVTPTISHYDLIGAVRELGLKIRCRDGHYKINYPEHVLKRKVRPPYRTGDRQDALNAARSMAIELENEESGLPVSTYTISRR
jgi:hypothetical protein